MTSPQRIARIFFLPSFNRGFCARVMIVAGIAFAFFGWLCIPMRISGDSMYPTYRNGQFNFCWCFRFGRSPHRRQSVVAIRLAGTRVMYLKRLVAFEGEIVEFRNGLLYVDGIPLGEPYVNGPCDWSLPPRRVEAGNVYVVGDNRSVSMEVHQFGQTPERRIAGEPLW